MAEISRLSERLSDFTTGPARDYAADPIVHHS